MNSKNYGHDVEAFLIKNFIPANYRITNPVKLDPIPESSKYDALNFGLNNLKIMYRKGNITPDRPGAFLAVWQRPLMHETNNKPIPYTANQLDYLFIYVEDEDKRGLFIFPVDVLIKKGILSSLGKKGKTGFRVFPPWSEDRGTLGTKVFSASGKKTQQWQLPYFIEINSGGGLDFKKINKLFSV